MKFLYTVLLSLLFMNASCAIQGEVYRLQTRVKNWYNILSQDEQILFAQNKESKLGLILDEKEQSNPIYQTNLRNIRISEAIMSFDGEQTVHFFYNILLRDLAKFSYEEFMNSLSVEEKKIFIKTTNFSSNPFSGSKNILERARKYYGFSSFSDVEILNYFRHVSFPANFYVTVYNILAFLARYHSMDVFLQGDIANTVVNLNNTDKLLQSKNISLRKQTERDLQTWYSLRERTYLKDLSDEDFLTLLYNNILPGMDESVRVKTIENIRQRFSKGE